MKPVNKLKKLKGYTHSKFLNEILYFINTFRQVQTTLSCYKYISIFRTFMFLDFTRPSMHVHIQRL